MTHHCVMGFITRRVIPRKVRRLAHPVRAVKRATKKAVTPKAVRKVSYSAHLATSPIYRATSGKKKTSPATTYTHFGCTVKHRTWEARSKCKKGW